VIPAQYYSIIFLYSVIILTFVACRKARQSYAGIRQGSRDFTFALLIAIIYALWIGYRPVSGYYFVDTANYAQQYYLMQCGIDMASGTKEEWLWNQLMYSCSQVMDVSGFFTLVDIGYFGFTLWACRRLTPNNVLVSFLFCLGALSFFSYGTNGIRNGLACSIILLMLSYIVGNKRDKIIAIILAYIAFSIHKSTSLPILMSVLSLLCIRSFKSAYTFWILSILISLVAGGAVTAFFASLGFDDRLQTYLTESASEKVFSHTGFRWDFFLYSMMPIVLGYIIVIKHGIQNKTYLMLLNTYTLANAFWVMVIRASFSNRFAYLSWFMYPVVLAYPLLKLDIWGKFQGKYLKNIMLAHVGFTWFMQTIYW